MKILGKKFFQFRIFGLLCALLLLVESVPAFAAPDIVRKRLIEARNVRAEINRIDREVDIAVEEYNQANLSLSQTRAAIAKESHKLEVAKRELARGRRLLSARVCAIYKNRGTSILEVVFGASSFDEFITRIEWLILIGRQDAKLVKEIEARKREIEKRKQELERKEKEEERLLAQARAKKEEIEKELAKRKALLAEIEGEIERFEREEREREQSLRLAYARSSGSITVSRGAPRSGVVGIALSLLGRPYRYGAAGPHAFDCSGFTMYCYAQVGISLPHSSAAQYSCGARVSRGELQPGDLVFFGHPIHHVGIYIGGGNYVHAPHTGDVVKVSPLTRTDYVGAVRP